jgi:hypothetical protein
MSDRASPASSAPETSLARPAAIVAKITSFYNGRRHDPRLMKRAAL